jgi:hypothetical protein
MGLHLMGMHLMGLHLMGLPLMGLHLMGVHLMGVHLMGVHLMGVHFMGVRLIGVCLKSQKGFGKKSLHPAVEGVLAKLPQGVKKSLTQSDTKAASPSRVRKSSHSNLPVG